MSEALLLQAVRDGSTAAFGILYARYRSLAVGVATQALPQADTALAEDVAEVSFIRVLTALRNGKGPTDTLRSYLATTVRREAWRAQRRRRRQAEVVERWAVGEERSMEPDPTPEPDPGPESGRDLGSHVLLGEAFRGLSDRWRHVLWLTAVEGRKPAEVAPMLGVSAGSASALAYRARNGLIAAYVAAYRRSTDDEECVAISDRLERFVAAGTPEDGFVDVVAHIEGCRACRDVSRGVDVLGSVLASMAPFGLLTAGLWAKASGIGAAGLVGGAAAAGSLGASQGLAGSTTTAAAASGGVGIGGAVAAAAAVVVLAGAAWFGVVDSDSRPTDTAAAAASGPEAPGTVTRRIGTGSTVTTGARPPGSQPLTSGPGAAPAATSPSPGAPTVPPTGLAPLTPPAPTTTRPGTPTTSTTPTRPTTPTTSSTSAPASSTTTTTLPPVEAPGILSGRATKASTQSEGQQDPVSGISVVAYDEQGELAGTAVTNSDGRWSLQRLPKGRYLVAAVVPAAYRPASGPDPFVGGSSWGTILGSVEVADQPLDLVDLRLVDR